MEDTEKLLESVLERAVEYGKTSLELLKLKALDKASDVVSSTIPHTLVIVTLTSFLLFLNLGLAFWLGEILGKVFLGFFVVAAFYAIAAGVVHFFMHKWLKKIIGNYFIKQMLK
jgi:hypothetical protein